jgi:acyl-CoA thioesterase
LQIPTIADAVYPAVYVKLDQPVPTPTIDLTVHFRSSLPRDYDWVLGRFETRYSMEGFIEEDGQIWGRDGTLIALSRQLALLTS